MKILTKEEEAEHSRLVWEGGIMGSVGGLALGAAGVVLASQRYHALKQLGLPFRGFLVTASTAFCGVIAADRYSRNYERSRHGDSDYTNKSEEALAQLRTGKDTWTKAKEWVSENRYPIVFGSWVASMVIAFGIVGRNPHQSPQQKLVQARVYAQGLTVAVLVASFALESNDLRAGKGRWETIKVLDPNDPDHKKLIDKRIHHEAYQGEDQWMDMIEAQEKKRKAHGHKVYDNEKTPGKGEKQGDDSAKQGKQEKKGSSQEAGSSNEDSKDSEQNGGANKKDSKQKDNKDGGKDEQKQKSSGDEEKESSSGKKQDAKA